MKSGVPLIMNCNEARKTMSSIATYLFCSLIILLEAFALVMLIPIGFGGPTWMLLLLLVSTDLALYFVLSSVINKRVLCIEKNGDSLKLTRLFSSSVLPIDSISKLVEYKNAYGTVLRVSFHADGAEKTLEMVKSKVKKYEEYREILEQSGQEITIIER